MNEAKTGLSAVERRRPWHVMITQTQEQFPKSSANVKVRSDKAAHIRHRRRMAHKEAFDPAFDESI